MSTACEIKENLVLEDLIYLERNVNQRSYSKFCTYTEVDKKYRPESIQPSFNLPVFRLPKKEVTIVDTELLSASVTNELVNKDGVDFFIHPQTLKEQGQFLKKGGYAQRLVRVYPTASTRTVTTVDDQSDYYVKLHLPKRISRFSRDLTAASIKHGLNITDNLTHLTLPDRFAFLPEVFGAYHNTTQWGYLIRQKNPYPIVCGKKRLIPYFSLHSVDKTKPNDLPLLVKLVKYHQADSMRFLVDQIIGPLIRQWCFLARQYGILLECHGQNTLLELDENNLPTRLVHRDFQGVRVDPRAYNFDKTPVPYEKISSG
jgi:hypothetical protein